MTLFDNGAWRARRVGTGRTLKGMADGWTSVVAWSAGVSATGAGMAAIFAAGRTGWQRVLFVIFVVIASVAFLILLAVGIQGFISWLRRTRGEPVAVPLPGPPASISQAPVGSVVVDQENEAVVDQENEVVGTGALFGVLDGKMIIHEGDPGQPPAVPPAPRPACPTAPNLGRIQRNVVRGNGQLFAVNDGDIHLYRPVGQRRPESSPVEGRESDEQT